MSLDAVELAHAPAAATETTAVTGRHLPALNGLRGVAVLGVVAYHLQLGWASGGYLGVDLFFVLSGFLISTLLLEEWDGSGRINLGAFWARRAKRLLPALFLVVAALALYLIFNAIFGGPGANGLVDLAGLRGDAIWTLLYANNWHLIYAHQSYFAQFSTPSPLQHTWSLAIEEQFYLVWPLVLLLLLRLARGAWRRTGMIITVTLGVLSAALMAVLFDPGVDPSRIYYGTDTRLFDLMAGATLAFVAASRPQPGRRSRRMLHRIGPLAAIALAVFWVTVGDAGRAAEELHVRGWLSALRGSGRPRRGRRSTRPAGPLCPPAGRPPAAFPGNHLLRHLPVALAGDRLPQRPSEPVSREWPLDLLRVGVTLASRPPATTWWSDPSAWPACTAGCAGRSRRWPASPRPSSSWWPRSRPSPTRPPCVGTSHLSRQKTAASAVPGAGGYQGQVPIHLTAAPTAADPLRVMILGDSVMHDASYGITAALGATGEATVATRTIDGFGLTTATNWPTSIPESHPPDPGTDHRGLVELGPVRADHAQRTPPTGPVHRNSSAAPWPPC